MASYRRFSSEFGPLDNNKGALEFQSPNSINI